MAEQETPVIFLHQVARRYHQGDATLEILKGAELAVWPGQSVALVAPSGAGKSTLLHIAGLLEQPDSGEVYLDGAATAALVDEATLAENEAVDLYRFTSQLNRSLDEDGRRRIVEMMWEMVYADGRASEFEDNLLWRAADLLGISSHDRIALRQRIGGERSGPVDA